MEIQALLNSATNWVLTMYPAHHSAYQSQDWLQHRQLLHKDRRKPFWTFTIGFEEAQAFRKAGGGYLRKNQWEDLTVDVYI